MNAIARRTALYGIAALLLAGLGYVGFVYERDADVGTLLNSAGIQLQLAYGMPAQDKQGKDLAARVDLIVTAEQSLAKVEQVEPGIASAAELLGFAHMLRGRFRDAAACYRRAQGCGDCGDEQRDILAFNEARMLGKAGDGDAALAVFSTHAGAFDQRFGHQRAIEEAGILRAIGRRTEAEARLDAVVAAEAVDPLAWLQAGEEYARLGCADKAERALLQIADRVPIADYVLARLKLTAGDVDSCFERLERAAAAAPAEVRRRIGDDRDAWQVLAGDARFQRFAVPPAATPGR